MNTFMPIGWMDGGLKPLEKLVIPIPAHSVQYGSALFEGIVFHECKDGRSAIFRLKEHIERLFKSARIVEFIEIPFTEIEVEKAIIETVKANKAKEGYIRPNVIVGVGGIGPLPHGNPIHLSIFISEPLKGYFGKNANEGISADISFWRRDERVMPYKAKIAGNYVNSALAKYEVEKRGFSEAVVLTTSGFLDEGSASNIFMVKERKLMTPHLVLPILEGITRNTLITLATDLLNLNIEAGVFTVDDFYDAEELFFCGTAAEITPVRDIGGRFIGKECPGPITKKLQGLYSKAIRGDLPGYESWLTYV